MDKVVCRLTLIAGSLMSSKRVCLTKREWVAADKKGQKSAEEVVRDGNKGAFFSKLHGVALTRSRYALDAQPSQLTLHSGEADVLPGLFLVARFRKF